MTEQSHAIKNKNDRKRDRVYMCVLLGGRLAYGDTYVRVVSECMCVRVAFDLLCLCA